MEEILAHLFIIRDLALDEDPFCATSQSSARLPRDPKHVPFAIPRALPQFDMASKNCKSHLGRLERILTGHPSLAASCPQQFILMTPPGFLASLSVDKRTVTRCTPWSQPAVHLSKSLDSTRKLVIRVDSFCQPAFAHSFLFCLTNTFYGNVISEFEVSNLAKAGTTVTFELATGRKLVVITVHGNASTSISYMYLATGWAAKTLFPVLKLSGNAQSLRIVNHSSNRPAHDLIRKRPNASSFQLSTARPRAESASSAYSSLVVTPSLSKPVVTKAAEIQEVNAIEPPPNAAYKKRKSISELEKSKSALFPKRKQTGRNWFSNQFMTFRDSVVTRSRSTKGKNYIFGSQFRVNQSFIVKIVDYDEETADSDEGALYLGFTKTPLLLLDFSALPVNPSDLCNNDSNWLLSANLFRMVGAFDGLRFSRTGTGVSMSIESGEWMDVMTGVDAATRISPFIYMGGCIKSVHVRSQ